MLLLKYNITILYVYYVIHYIGIIICTYGENVGATIELFNYYDEVEEINHTDVCI